MNLYRVQIIYFVLCVLTLVLFAAGIFANILFLGAMGGITAVVAILFHFVFPRCPRCRKHLNSRELKEFCPYCGEVLTDDVLKD